MLNSKIPVPLYQQLKNALKADINNQKYKDGEKIPTETEICKKYNVSRITVRKAIQELVEEGYLIKWQGIGTFVNSPKIDRKIEHVMGFTSACKANGMKSFSRVTIKEIIKPDQTLKQLLELNAGEKVLYIQRVRYADDRPIMLENNYYPYNRFSFLLNESLEGSLYDLLKEKYQIDPINSGESTLEIVLADDEKSSLLECPIGKALFYLFTSIYDQNNKPVHVGKQYIIGDRYKFIL